MPVIVLIHANVQDQQFGLVTLHVLVDAEQHHLLYVYGQKNIAQLHVDVNVL